MFFADIGNIRANTFHFSEPWHMFACARPRRIDTRVVHALKCHDSRRLMQANARCTARTCARRASPDQCEQGRERSSVPCSRALPAGRPRGLPERSSVPCSHRDSPVFNDSGTSSKKKRVSRHVFSIFNGRTAEIPLNTEYTRHSGPPRDPGIIEYRAYVPRNAFFLARGARNR